MRNLPPERRRAAAIAGACAAIIPSTSLLMEHSHSKPMEFTGGLIIGLTFTLTIATFIRARRSCS